MSAGIFASAVCIELECFEGADSGVSTSAGSNIDSTCEIISLSSDDSCVWSVTIVNTNLPGDGYVVMRACSVSEYSAPNMIVLCRHGVVPSWAKASEVLGPDLEETVTILIKTVCVYFEPVLMVGLLA